MKKMLSIFLIMLVIIGMFASCNVSEEHTNANTNDNTSTDATNDTDISVDNSTELYEKHGNKVYIECVEKDLYYPEIREYEEVSNCFDIPLNENGTKKVGAYLRFIATYEDLLTYIIPAELDSSIFDSNYIVCVKQFFYDDGHEKRLIGYYELNFSDDKYNICLDYYKSVDQAPHDQVAISYEYTSFIIVPKNSVEYTEQLRQVTVNGRNDIEDEIYVDNSDGLIQDPVENDGEQINVSVNKTSHYYITYNASATLPEDPTSWVIEKGSELAKSYGFEYYNKYSEMNFKVILYLPNEPKCDFIITEKEIKNGNLYLTIEEYTQYTNEYLNQNDVKFYDLYIQDTSELVDNFDVYLLIKTIK